jgi:(1->4)-alpha-D-glucan 1-alpha-D-glucosylmutase
VFGVSLKDFHAAAANRARNRPYAMLGSSTHDTKRSEDVRARLGVLSQLAPGWRLALRRWSRMNEAVRTGDAPSRADEYLYYQTLLAIWPDRSRERLSAAMLKAAREAKLRTSWINPDLEYEAALEQFITGSLRNREFIADVEETARPLLRLGHLAGLSQALVKIASPGVPDYYQGTEIWDFSLVDPDNRRPVDYALRKRLLSRNDHPKLRVIRKGLELRRKHPALFHGGSYVPLDGGENVIAFALRAEGRTLIAVAPRLVARHEGGSDAQIALPAGFPAAYENVLTSAAVKIEGGQLRLAKVLSDFPVALLIDT